MHLQNAPPSLWPTSRWDSSNQWCYIRWCSNGRHHPRCSSSHSAWGAWNRIPAPYMLTSTSFLSQDANRFGPRLDLRVVTQRHGISHRRHPNSPFSSRSSRNTRSGDRVNAGNTIIEFGRRIHELTIWPVYCLFVAPLSLPIFRSPATSIFFLKFHQFYALSQTANLDSKRISQWCRLQQQPIQLSKFKHAAIKITATDRDHSSWYNACSLHAAFLSSLLTLHSRWSSAHTMQWMATMSFTFMEQGSHM